jgi:predicted O-methyltransferase YrrM
MRSPIFDFRITDYDSRLVPNRLVAELDAGAVAEREWIATTGFSLGHPGWGLVYHLLLTLLDPARDNFVVETGTNLGSTSLIIAQAIADSGRRCEFHTIEIDPDFHATALARFAEAGMEERIVAHLGDSLEVLPRVVAMGECIDIAFLDGNHLHDHVIAEFAAVESKLRDDGAVIIDNSYLIAEGTEDPRVNGALRTILDQYGGNVVNLPFCSWWTTGMAIWQRQAFADMSPPVPGSWRAAR